MTRRVNCTVENIIRKFSFFLHANIFFSTQIIMRFIWNFNELKTLNIMKRTILLRWKCFLTQKYQHANKFVQWQSFISGGNNCKLLICWEWIALPHNRQHFKYPQKCRSKFSISWPLQVLDFCTVCSIIFIHFQSATYCRVKLMAKPLWIRWNLIIFVT